MAVKQYTSHFHITNKRLVTRTGLLSRQSNEILLQKIETVSVTQGALERLLDCGDIQLTGTGSARKPIREIAAPIMFRNYLTKAIAQEDVSPSQQRTHDDKKREALTVIILAVIVWVAMTILVIFYSLSLNSSEPNFNSSLNKTTTDPITNPIENSARNGDTSEQSAEETDETFDGAAYMLSIQGKIKQSWHPPASSQPIKVIVRFTVDKSGTTSSARIMQSSHDAACDASALKAISEVNPLPKLGAGSPPKIEVEYTFDVPGKTNTSEQRATDSVGESRYD